MLVLTRKIGEAITVGDNIRITVVEIQGQKVRLGIVAPKETIVDRQAIHEKRLSSVSDAPVLARPQLTAPE